MTMAAANNLTDEQSPAAAAAAAAAADEITTTSTACNSAALPLPLGWTQISRNNKRRKASGDEDPECCEDPSCRRRQPKPTVSTATTETPTISLQGQAIFMWCEIDPQWFQGYFVVPLSGRKPMGLLAQQTAIDECLACADGGYREISLQVFQKPLETHVISDIAWTGGDMMTLEQQTSKLAFETERLLTGKKAVPLVEQHFSGLIKKLSKDAEEEDLSILELLPDVAILVGNMKLSLPKNE